MNWVTQIISTVTDNGKVAWSFLLACAGILFLNYFFPDLFTGLPEWVFPTIIIATIFFLTLSIATIFQPLKSKLCSLCQFSYAPLKRRSIRKKLLLLNVREVLILCRAIAEGDSKMSLNPDLAPVINLQENGIIETIPWIHWGGKTLEFKIPREVWRILLSMREFNDFNHEKFLNAIHSGRSLEDILASLPQAHPAVHAAQ